MNDNGVSALITQLIHTSNEDIQALIESAGKTINDHNKAAFDAAKHGKPAPEESEDVARARTVITLGNQFLYSRRKEDDFDPYAFMGINPPAPPIEPAV